MSDHEFQLLMGRMENQDRVLERIEEFLKGINGRVQKNERDISFAKGMGYMSNVLLVVGWAVWTWFTRGGK